MNMNSYNTKLKINGRDFIFPIGINACGNCYWFKDTEGHPTINNEICLRSDAKGECCRFPQTVKGKNYFDLCGEWKYNSEYKEIKIKRAKLLKEKL